MVLQLYALIYSKCSSHKLKPCYYSLVAPNAGTEADFLKSPNVALFYRKTVHSDHVSKRNTSKKEAHTIIQVSRGGLETLSEKEVEM